MVTHVGLDSFGLPLPAPEWAAAFRKSEQNHGGGEVDVPAHDMGGHTRSLTLIVLAPTPTYGHFIDAIRDLRARGKCNLMVREGAQPTRNLDGAQDWRSMALVLCGRSIGDAGFYGTLPPDGPL